MTVWIVNPFDNLPTEGFRPQRYWMMSMAFIAAGHRVVYFTADFNHGTKAKRRETRTVDEPGNNRIQVQQIPVREYRKNVGLKRLLSHRDFASGFGARATTLATDRRPDVIIASAPPLGSATVALRLARECGAKFIVDIQDAWPETFHRLLPNGFKWLGRLLFAPLYSTARRLYASADKVSGVSAKYTKLSGRSDYYLAYLGILDKTSASSFSSASSASSFSSSSSPSRRLIYLGNLGEGYDLETVIRALGTVPRETGTVPRLELDIAGKGPKELKLLQLVKRLGLEKEVRFHGYLNEEDLKRLLSECDIGLIPMRNDSFVGLPNKLYDYLAAGLQVVSSLDGECGQLLREFNCGKVYAEGDRKSFLEAVGGCADTGTSLPGILKAENIYSGYVKFATSPIVHSPGL